MSIHILDSTYTVNHESTKNQTYATKLVKVPKEDFRLSEHKEAFHLGLF